jgi:tetratricopeptide (TPR) repeat protein
VVRVVSYYAAGAFVALEASDILSDNLHLPDWVMTVVIILLVVLFIGLAVISWIYDITPEGIRKTAPASMLSPDTSVPGPIEKRNWFVRHRVVRRYMVPALIVGLVIVFYLNKDRIFQNWKRENKVAKAQTEVAIMFLNNRAPAGMIKQELDLALEADPEYAPALHTYAMVHLVEGDSLLARQKLHKILNSDPGYSGAWNLLASLAFWQDSTELAMRYSTNALDTGPTNSVAIYNLAILSEDRGFYNQAEACFLKAIDIDSTFTSAYSALGALYNKLARPTEAELILRRTLRISPASPHNYRVYKNLAESHLMLQDYVTAFEYLEKAKALEPNYADTEKCFALYYEARGYMQESIPHWRMYVALETDSLEQQKAQRHLDSLRFHMPQ